ncbi:MAG: hypothetical protein K2X02_06865 [Alphaproteobacteria bacterium]|nr:hypothetical protein [Alphaproteobacteria bacterium]
MDMYKFNFSKILNSAVLTLFLLSSTAAFAMEGSEKEKPNTPAIQMKAPSSLPSPELEVAPAPSAHAALSSPDELQLQELQRKAEIARLQRQIAEDEAATAVLLGQQQAAPQPDLLGQALLGAFRGGRSDARVQRNLDKLGLGGFGSFLGLPPRK